MHPTRLTKHLGVGLIALGLVGGALLSRLAPPAPARTLEWLAEPRPLAPFSLQTAAGPWGRANLATGWHLLVFGYTQCPDVCPASLAEAADLIDLLEEIPLQVAFISLDPQRDSPGQLARYVQFYRPDFIGATGSTPELETLAGSLGIRFRKADTGELAHTPILSLVDPDGYLRARLRIGFDRRATASVIAAVIERET